MVDLKSNSEKFPYGCAMAHLTLPPKYVEELKEIKDKDLREIRYGKMLDEIHRSRLPEQYEKELTGIDNKLERMIRRERIIDKLYFNM